MSNLHFWLIFMMVVILFLTLTSFFVIVGECRILRGNGEVVKGDQGVVYTHRNLAIES